MNALNKVTKQLASQLDTIIKQSKDTFEIMKQQAREAQEKKDSFDPAFADKDDFSKQLNLFNIRKHYHDLSLKLRSEEVDGFGHDPIFDAFISPLFEFLYTTYWRVETHGLEHIPTSGPALMVGNHSGSLPYDAIMLKVALKHYHSQHRDLRFLVEDFIFHFPFLGALIHRFGGVRACPENAEMLLQQGQATIVFPEGVKGLGKLYRNKYQLARFGRGGFVKLCLRTRCPLVPVAFVGPEEIHPMLYREETFSRMMGVPYFPVTPTFPWLGPLGLIPLPSKWSIHVLPPIDLSSYEPDAENDRVLVYKLTQLVKSQIQDTINSVVKKRASIWF